MCGNESDRRDANNGPRASYAGANIQRRGPSTRMMTCAVGSSPRAAEPSVPTPDHTMAEKAYGWVLRIIESEGPAILRLLWRILGSEADVMDAYQDCFCKLATRKSAKGLRSTKAYAYRTATNIAIEIIRSRSRRRAHLPAVAAERANQSSDGPAPDDDAERFTGLRDAIGQLPTHLGNVIVLRDLSRLPYEEVGRTLGISPATARVYRRHAVVKLAELLGKGEGS